MDKYVTAVGGLGLFLLGIHLWLPKIASGLAQMPRWAILALGCLTS